MCVSGQLQEVKKRKEDEVVILLKAVDHGNDRAFFESYGRSDRRVPSIRGQEALQEHRSKMSGFTIGMCFSLT
jgi:hypothetical protein